MRYCKLAVVSLLSICFFSTLSFGVTMYGQLSANSTMYCGVADNDSTNIYTRKGSAYLQFGFNAAKKKAAADEKSSLALLNKEAGLAKTIKKSSLSRSQKSDLKTIFNAVKLPGYKKVPTTKNAIATYLKPAGKALKALLFEFGQEGQFVDNCQGGFIPPGIVLTKVVVINDGGIPAVEVLLRALDHFSYQRFECVRPANAAVGTAASLHFLGSPCTNGNFLLATVQSNDCKNLLKFNQLGGFLEEIRLSPGASQTEIDTAVQTLQAKYPVGFVGRVQGDGASVGTDTCANF